MVKGEKNLIEALKAKFGAALAIYRSGHMLNESRLIDAARTFGAATAVVGPHGFGLVHIL